MIKLVFENSHSVVKQIRELFSTLLSVNIFAIKTDQKGHYMGYLKCAKLTPGGWFSTLFCEKKKFSTKKCNSKERFSAP